MDKLTFSVDTESRIAVYVQIQNQIVFAVAAGRIKPGQTLPSIREMSTLVGVNPNTVTKAYRDLELGDLVSTRRGVGVTVTGNARATCRQAALATVQGHVKSCMRECLDAGLTAVQAQKLVSEALKTI